jgi:hypothetical protein
LLDDDLEDAIRRESRPKNQVTGTDGVKSRAASDHEIKAGKKKVSIQAELYMWGKSLPRCPVKRFSASAVTFRGDNGSTSKRFGGRTLATRTLSHLSLVYSTNLPNQ